MQHQFSPREFAVSLAFARGWNAALAGERLLMNPYSRFASVEHGAWRKGYDMQSNAGLAIPLPHPFLRSATL
jgi:hypothetical protein